MTIKTIKNPLPLKFKRLHETATLPSYATSGAACFDFYSCFYQFKAIKVYSEENDLEEIKIQYDFLLIEPGDRILIPTGICADIPEGYCIKIYSRSGMSFTNGLMLTNGVGVVDSDYTDEIFISMTNVGKTSVVLNSNIRIAQGELVPYIRANIQEIDPGNFTTGLDKKGDRTGGFGSTGA